MLNRQIQVGSTVAFCAAYLCVAGCNSGRANRSAYATAPGLSGDAPLSNRGGSNPNAPYTTLDHSARLVKRTAPLDVNAALPCVASDLNLFESGAHIDGEHRSVRLNLVNHGKAPCRVGGYPSISLVRQDGSLIGNIAIEKVTATTLEAALHPKVAAAASGGTLPVAATQTALPSPYVLLAPSGEATFEVGWTSGQKCDQVGAIAVAAPGTLQSFTVHHAITVCEGRIQVTAISDGAQL